MRDDQPCISLLAGPNGAGKSSVGGEFLRQAGGAYWNPDEVARAIRSANASMDARTANARAWAEGLRLLDDALRDRHDFYFETTLGGQTITARMRQACHDGFAVRVWYAALATPELHVARVAARVRRGGHDIPAPDIRRRYRQSLLNLITLLPDLTELVMYDNSLEGDPAAGVAPRPILVLHMQRGKIVGPPALAATPAWAQPVVAAALKL